jgi:CheY-like chemotaxis protein
MKKILHIDESESNRLLQKEDLSEEGYAVVPATSNEMALSDSRRAKPDLLILELRQRNPEVELTIKEL